MPETSIDSQIGESVAHASHLPEQGRDRFGDNSAQRFESLKAEAAPGLELKADIFGVSVRFSREGIQWGSPNSVAEYMEQAVVAHLKGRAATFGFEAVRRDLDELNPKVQVIGSDNRVHEVRALSGIRNGDQPIFLEVGAQPFEVSGNLVKVGGYWFEVSKVAQTLAGAGDLHPWTEVSVIPRTNQVVNETWTLPLKGGFYEDAASGRKLSFNATVCVEMPYGRREGLQTIVGKKMRGEPLPKGVEKLTLEQMRNEEYLVSDRPINHEYLLEYRNVAEIKIGSKSLRSPDHPNQDRLVVGVDLKNRLGQVVGRRLAVIDMAGGSLDGDWRYTDGQKENLIIRKGDQIRDLLESPRFSTMDAQQTLDTVDREVSADSRNRSQGGVVVIDVFEKAVTIAGKGDPPVGAWRESGFASRRGLAWANKPDGRGAPSNFQLLNVPGNMEHIRKAAGITRRPTMMLDEADDANQPVSAVGAYDGKTKPYVVTIARSEIQDFWLLAGSDGTQIASALLEPTTDYSRGVHKTMLAVAHGQPGFNENRAAFDVCLGSRTKNLDRDDISAEVIRIPKIQA